MARRTSTKFRLFAVLLIQSSWLLALLSLALRNPERDFPYLVGLGVCLMAAIGLGFLVGRLREAS